MNERVHISFDLYLVKGNSHRYILFSPPDTLHRIEAQSADRIQTFLQWFMRRKNRLAAWLGRMINALHEYYLRLEDKLDPQERVLKAMACTDHMSVYHASTLNAQIRSKFEAILRRERVKHIFWFSVDLVLSIVALALTPILAPLPGPNIFLYYPFLRLLSHYRAITGAAQGLRSRHVDFKSLPDLSALEDNLPGLRMFIRRMS